MLIVLYSARFKMGNKTLKKREREGETERGRQGGRKGTSEGQGEN